MNTLSLKNYLCAIVAKGFGPDGKPSADSGCRREIRLRMRTLWVVSGIEADWVWTILPYSRRLAIVFDEKGRAHPFNRTVCTPETEWKASYALPPGTIVPYTCVDCSVSKDGKFVVYDVLSIGNKSTCALPLHDRLALCPSCLPHVEYYRIDEQIQKAAASMDGTRRLLIVDPKTAYRPHLYSRSAISWKPAYPANTAVLCCRGGKALSMLRDDSVLLHEEGPIESAQGTGSWSSYNMDSFLCLYNSQKRVWIPLHKVKRGDHLYTAEQVELVRKSEPQPHGSVVFETLFEDGDDLSETKK